MRLIMTQSQPVALVKDWQLWDGRIVNGKYPLQRFLGESGGIAAYLTEMNGAAAVIKLLAADAANVRAQAASWKLAERLSHPNLVRVFETGLWHADDEHDMQFAVMEYCEESLDAVLRQRPLTPDDARQLLPPTLEALRYLHHHGILHGGLNPASILANGDQLKLSTDHLRRCTDMASASVASRYDAPEKSSGTMSLTSDIWALGMTLHEALTRRLPGRNKDSAAEITDKLPSPFDEIVKQCLASDRERRPSLAAIAILLEQPAPVLVSDKSVPADASPTRPADMRMIRPDDSTTPPEPEVLEKEASERSWLKTIEKRPALMAAVALLLLFVILIGIRRSQDNKTASPAASPAIMQQPASAISATPAATVAQPGSPDIRSAASGAVLHQALPEIPERVRSTINGTVKVRVKVAVTADGKVSNATLSVRGPSAYFARQALEAAQHWTFAPPVYNGKSQASDWLLHFEFRRSGTRASAQRV